jgi:hypothetical protein
VLKDMRCVIRSYENPYPERNALRRSENVKKGKMINADK